MLMYFIYQVSYSTVSVELFCYLGVFLCYILAFGLILLYRL